MTTRNDSFDLDQEIRWANVRVNMLIDMRAWQAQYRLDEMHAVGTGVCHCGMDMYNHQWDETHSPVEMMRDKSYGTDDTIQG